MFSYEPPANLDDLAGRPTRSGFLKDWGSHIAGAFRNEILALTRIRPPLDPLFATEVDGEFLGSDIPVTWNAFPLAIGRLHPDDSVAAWQDANVPGFVNLGRTKVKVRRQDEYCEWFEYRSNGLVQRIVFTAEAPEYWVRLANQDLDQVVNLYQAWVSQEVKKSDLLLSEDMEWQDETLKAGTYNPFNVWNTEKGVMHLTHPANTLGAEINLAARATVLRRDETDARIIDVRHLACCSNFGDANRSSDPNIGSAVNTSCVTPDGKTIRDITLSNPVALYIDSLQNGALTGPNDEPLDGWFNIVRGVKGRGLMAVLTPPTGAPFGLDQVKVKGIRLSYGGQVAEVIQMVLYAKVRPHSEGEKPVHTYKCLKRCCVKKGTDPATYKNINFDPPDQAGNCESGAETAYQPSAQRKNGASPSVVESYHEEENDLGGPAKRAVRVDFVD